MKMNDLTEFFEEQKKDNEQVQQEETGITVTKYMTETTITRYPGGQEYISSRTWFVGNKAKPKKKKVKAKKVKQVEIASTEEY